MDDIKIDVKLKEIFENINNWLKFAEAKNATLVGGNGVIIFGIIKCLKDLENYTYFVYYLYFVIAFLSLSCIIALISFMANIKLPQYLFGKVDNKNNNLLFYGSIQNYNEEEYLKKLTESLGISDSSIHKNKFCLMYAQQIIINSKITMRKFELFNIGLKITLFAILSPILYLFFWMMQ